MADNDPALPVVTPEQRQTAASQYERASQVIAAGNPEYGIQLLLDCCRLDPANLIYRQALRRTEKTKYRHNLRGSWLAWLTASPARARIRTAKRNRAYLKVLEHGEEVLLRNPWDIAAQMDMAEAADSLGLPDLAVWILEQARQKDGQLAPLNRSLARLYEKRGNYSQAIVLWELVRQVDPSDLEAGHKAAALGGQPDVLRNGTASKKEPGNLAELRSRIEAEPTGARHYLQLAAHHRQLGQLDQARAVLEQGLGPTGNDFLLTMELADLALAPFRQDLAIAEAKLRADPDNPDLRQIRQQLAKEINARELDIYRRKSDRYPGDCSCRLELAIRLFHADQLDEAMVELEAARADIRCSARALLYLGRCLKIRKKENQARESFEEALKLVQSDDEPLRQELLQEMPTSAA